MGKQQQGKLRGLDDDDKERGGSPTPLHRRQLSPASSPHDPLFLFLSPSPSLSLSLSLSACSPGPAAAATPASPAATTLLSASNSPRMASRSRSHACFSASSCAHRSERCWSCEWRSGILDARVSRSLRGGMGGVSQSRRRNRGRRGGRECAPDLLLLALAEGALGGAVLGGSLCGRGDARQGSVTRRTEEARAPKRDALVCLSSFFPFPPALPSASPSPSTAPGESPSPSVVPPLGLALLSGGLATRCSSPAPAPAGHAELTALARRVRPDAELLPVRWACSEGGDGVKAAPPVGGACACGYGRVCAFARADSASAADESSSSDAERRRAAEEEGGERASVYSLAGERSEPNEGRGPEGGGGGGGWALVDECGAS